MIEDIRKQHEELRDLIKPDQRDYIQPCISISDVDALFAALDEARGRVEKAIEQCDTEYGYVPVVGLS